MRVLVFAPVLLLLSAVLPVWLSTRQATPTIAAAAAVIAITSVTVTAVSSYASWARTRSQATLEAWSAWKDGSAEDRRELARFFSVDTALNREQSACLDQGLAFHVIRRSDGTMRRVDEEGSRELRRRLRRVLNGLERLAVGAETMIYDRDVLMQIGGTMIVASYARYEEFIARARERNTRIYAALHLLVSEAESAQGRGRRRLFDEARVRRIEQTRARTGTGRAHGKSEGRVWHARPERSKHIRLRLGRRSVMDVWIDFARSEEEDNEE